MDGPEESEEQDPNYAGKNISCQLATVKLLTPCGHLLSTAEQGVGVTQVESFYILPFSRKVQKGQIASRVALLFY